MPQCRVTHAITANDSGQRGGVVVCLLSEILCDSLLNYSHVSDVTRILMQTCAVKVRK